MNFGKAIQLLKQGRALYRDGWNGKGLFVVKQVPCSIGPDVIPGMQSLPQSAKDILMSRENKYINYTNQMLIINQDGRADSWVPSSSDIFADDWNAIDYEDNYLTRMKEESADLYFKKEKLGEFIGCKDTDEFKNLEEKMQELLKLQYDAMCEYGKILDERIVLCEAKENKMSD